VTGELVSGQVRAVIIKLVSGINAATNSVHWLSYLLSWNSSVWQKNLPVFFYVKP